MDSYRDTAADEVATERPDANYSAAQEQVPLPALAPTPSAKRPKITRAVALAARERERRGFRFELFRTMPGEYAHVKRLSLADRTMLGSLPTAMQERVLRLLNETRGDGDAGPLTIAKITKNQTRQEDLANAFCVAGFLDPTLVGTEDELANNFDALVVTDLALEERLAYLNACLGNDEVAARRLEPFPDESDGAVVGLPTDVPDGDAPVLAATG